MNKIKSVIKIGLWLSILAVLPIAWLNANSIVDRARLINYSPPAAVTNLVSDTSMTSYARHLFYLNKPKIETDVSAFRLECTENEQTIVLGCYESGQNGISIYDVQDDRLEGVVQVTAAHEMLHSAYERLSTKDRKYVDGLLRDYSNTQLKDQRLIDTIESYKKTELNDIPNEMHSIFGTEIKDLPVELENYYKRYFTNRQAVVAYALNYQAEFTSRSKLIANYDSQLADLKNQINSEEASLNTQSAKINNDRALLKTYQDSNQISAYNALVPLFNSEVTRYNTEVTNLRSDISRYNALVNTRNSIAEELRGLDGALDTRLTTQMAQ